MFPAATWRSTLILPHMFTPAELENILFLDCETASITAQYDDLSPRMQALWDKKSKRYEAQYPGKSTAELFPLAAGIHAEFSQVVCISVGNLQFDENGIPHMKMKSWYSPNEVENLQELTRSLDKFTSSRESRFLCAHNGKEFDFPFLGRRYLIRQLPLPLALRVQGRKPWETMFIDTMELWKFGDYKAYTSLDLLAAVLDIPSPKDDIDGAQVGRVFWEEKDYERIRIYCEKDVLTTAQVLLRMSRLPLVPQQ